MDLEKYVQLRIDKGYNYNNIITNFFIENYQSLALKPDLHNRITDKINEKADFELTVSEMVNIIPLLDLRIGELIRNPDFNPFKEKLRMQNPLQYESYPFFFNGEKYYLYPKGWEVDMLILRTAGFKELLRAIVEANKPLKFKYKSLKN